MLKKTDYATEISSIKNDYVTQTALTSQINDLESQHISDEIKKVDDKVSKDSSDILGFESRLKQKEDELFSQFMVINITTILGEYLKQTTTLLMFQTQDIFIIGDPREYLI